MKIKTYLVGGAVRDSLLGLPVKERDWVVVGATPANLRRQGFRQVGRDFPVFLHPESNEEYALARRERKTGPGYTGFDFDASPAVTLEEDLLRRDLTINAMAQAPDGTIIDPFQGRADLESRVLRHVSAAFSEDPVRILRVARFAARFADLQFQVAKETLVLMQGMVQSGEVDALVPERVWKELERALAEPRPDVFFDVLAACDALPVLFPEGVLQGQSALRAALLLTNDPVIRFAVVLHGLTLQKLDSLCTRLRVPNDYSQLAQLVVRFLPIYETVTDCTAEQIVKLLQDLDAFRRAARFEKWLIACQACLPGGSQPALLGRCLQAAVAVDTRALAQGASGPEIAQRIRDARIQAVANILLS